MQRPPGVHVKNGRYYFVRQNKWHPLTRIERGDLALLEAYYALTKEDPRTMAGVLLAYLKDGTAELKAATVNSYRKIVIYRLIPFCGHMPTGTLRPGQVAKYLEQRKQAGAAVAGNRERATLSSACTFAMRRGWLESNPCYGVRRNREKPASRYVEHDELVPALDRAPPELYHLLAAAYLTGLRQADLMLLRKAQLTPRGIEVTESKTGKPRTIAWSPTLRQIIQGATARSTLEQVFVSRTGKAWTFWGLQSAMRRFAPGFRFRDLRPKAETDQPGILGHTGQMQLRYTRRQTFKPVK